MRLHPIRTEADYQQALQVIEDLFDAAPDTPELDHLDILSTLVDAYEKQQYPIALPDPIEAILYYMEARDWSRRDLEACLGSRARVSEILSRKRSLSLEMIRKLNLHLGISAEVLIQPYPILQKAA